MGSILKKRRGENGMDGAGTRPKKKFRRQLEYHSSSSDDEVQRNTAAIPAAVSLEEGPDSEATDKSSLDAEVNSQASLSDGADDDNAEANPNLLDADKNPDSASDDPDSNDDSDSQNIGSSLRRKLSKRNDPTAFSTSISKILSSKLSSSARLDPLLARNKSAAQTTADLANEKLEMRARAKIRAEKKEELDRGRIRDVLGIDRGEAGEVAEQEKKLRKVAQRGVIKLFNAVRAAQVRGEQAAREQRSKRSILGMGEREKVVNEVSKQGFLDLIIGKQGKAWNIEEA